MTSDSSHEPGSVIDAHVHFWDPDALPYPWLSAVPLLQRSYLPHDYFAADDSSPVEKVVFVEANPAPDRNLDEAAFVAQLARIEPRIAGIVAFVDLTDASRRDADLDALAAIPQLRGVRHNIQGQPAGFCLQTEFVAGVREVGRRGLPFDLCTTHDLLADVLELVRRAPDTRFVLDHCGKPGIRAAQLDPWRGHMEQLAGQENVWCKLSGLLTEADPRRWANDDLAPYADHVATCFGTDRLIYGSDWPVVTLASRSSGWYPFTRWFTREWSDPERDRFYRENAIRLYEL